MISTLNSPHFRIRFNQHYSKVCHQPPTGPNNQMPFKTPLYHVWPPPTSPYKINSRMVVYIYMRHIIYTQAAVITTHNGVMCRKTIGAAYIGTLQKGETQPLPDRPECMCNSPLHCSREHVSWFLKCPSKSQNLPCSYVCVCVGKSNQVVCMQTVQYIPSLYLPTACLCVIRGPHLWPKDFLEAHGQKLRL